MIVTAFRSVTEFCTHLDKSSSRLDTPFVQNSSDISQFKPVYLPDYTDRPRHKYYVIVAVTYLAVFLLTFNNSKSQTPCRPVIRLRLLSTTTCLHL